jgi:hypothetical protein
MCHQAAPVARSTIPAKAAANAARCSKRIVRAPVIFNTALYLQNVALACHDFVRGLNCKNLSHKRRSKPDATKS